MAFIGMTLEGTPKIVALPASRRVDFLDEAETVNALVPELQAQGVETIVVLLHQGGVAAAGGSETVNMCGISTGRFRDRRARSTTRSTSSSRATRTRPYICVHRRRSSRGAGVAAGSSPTSSSTIDRSTGDPTAIRRTTIVSRDVTPDAGC